MKLRQIDTTNPSDRRKFTDLPFHLYKNNTCWVPPLASELPLVLNRNRHPFYQHSEADFFVVEDDREVIGRIAALHNRNYSEFHHSPTGFFYYFECVDDAQAAGMLFDAATEWCRRHGVQSILGPKGFLRSNGLGLLVEGFDLLPAVGIAYNFPYYETFVLNAGFQKETDHLSGFMTDEIHLPDKVYAIAEKVKERGKFWVKNFKDRSEMRSFIPLVNSVHHEAFYRNPGYYPTTDAEFKLLADSIISIAQPDTIKVIMHENEVAGFILSYPNISRALQKTGGRLWPFGWITIKNAMRTSRIFDLNGVGILPKYQGMGANAILYTELDKLFRANHAERAEIIQVDERNFMSKSDMENMAVQWNKRHRSYRLHLS